MGRRLGLYYPNQPEVAHEEAVAPASQFSTHVCFLMSTQTSPRVVNLKSHSGKERKRVRPKHREGKEEASLTSRSGDAALNSATLVISKQSVAFLFASIAFRHYKGQTRE